MSSNSMRSVRTFRLAGLALAAILVNTGEHTALAKANPSPRSTRPASNAKAVRKAKFAKLHLLRPQELALLSNRDRLKYYQSLHKIMLVVDAKHFKFTPKSSKPTKTAFDLLFPEAFAADRVENDPCLIGGYFGRWQAKGNSLSCSQPDENQNWEDKENHNFLCGKTDSGEQKAYCNSAFFLYASDKHDRICAPMGSFTENCNAAFQKRYGSDASLLKKDTANLMMAMGKEEIDIYHKRAEDYLNYMIESDDADAASAQILTDQLGIINAIRDSATKIYNKLAKEPTIHPGVVAKPVAAPAEQKPAPAKPVQSSPKDTTPKETTPKDTTPHATTPQSAPQSAPPPPPPPPASSATPVPDSKLLGKELSCVRNGLVNAGYTPSEKYIAFVAAGVQAARGPWNSSGDDSSRHQLQSAVISTIQAFGFCDESSYPSTQIESDDFVKIRRLITADEGRATGSRSEYFNNALFGSGTNSDESVRQGSLYQLFGMRGQPDKSWLGYQKAGAVDEGWKWTFLDELNWQHKTIAERQSVMNDLKVQSGTQPMPFESCQTNLKEKQKQKGGAFDLQVLRSTRERRITPDDTAAMRQVSAASLAFCKSMADACQLNANDTCNAKGFVQQASGPIKSAPASPENGAAPTSGGQREQAAPGPRGTTTVK